MATTLDRLKFIISADASSAISAFEQVAASADQNFEMASDRLDKVANKLVGFGATALAGAGLVGRQFYRITVGASDLNETVNKTKVVFGDAFEEIDKYARGASRAIGTSRRQALDAASSFGLFGKSAGKSGKELATFTTDLVSLSADLASFFNTSIPDAQQALSAALRGESEPIRRYNVLLNDAALKARAMSMAIYDGKGPLTGQQKILAAYREILAQTSDAQGDFARTSDGLANSQRTLDANIQDLKDSIGEAFLPALQTVVGGAGDVVKQFNDLNQSTDGAIGKMTAFGTAAVALTGALALISGLAMKARSALTDVDGELNNLGRTAKVTAYALATLAISDVVMNALNDLTGKTEALTESLQELIGVSDDIALPVGRLTSEFANMAKAEDDALKLSHLWTDWGKKIAIAGTDAKRPIEDIDAAFNKLIATSPKIAQQTINDLLALTATLDRNSQQYKDNIMLVERYEKKLKSLQNATEALTNAEEENIDTGEEDLELKRKREEAARRLAERLKALREAIKESGVDAQKRANDLLQEARERFNSYRDSVASTITSVYSFAGALGAMRSAQQADVDATRTVATARDALKSANDRVADSNRDVANARRELAVAEKSGMGEQIYSARERLTEALKRQTEATEAASSATTALNTAEQKATETTDEADKTFLERLQEQADTATGFADKVSKLISMGLSQESLQQVLSAGSEAGGLIADQIIGGGQAAIDKTNELTKSVNDAAKRVGTEGAKQWYQAGVDNAVQLVKGVDDVVKKYKVRLKSKQLSEKQLKKLQKQFNVAVDFEFVSREFEVPEAAKGGIVRARSGGQLVRVGEAGQDEAIIPLPNGMKQGNGGNIEINISTGVGDPVEIGRQVVSALQAYQRRSGAIPIKVS